MQEIFSFYKANKTKIVTLDGISFQLNVNIGFIDFTLAKYLLRILAQYWQNVNIPKLGLYFLPIMPSLNQRIDNIGLQSGFISRNFIFPMFSYFVFKIPWQLTFMSLIALNILFENNFLMMEIVFYER